MLRRLTQIIDVSSRHTDSAPTLSSDFSCEPFPQYSMRPISLVPPTQTMSQTPRRLIERKIACTYAVSPLVSCYIANTGVSIRAEENRTRQWVLDHCASGRLTRHIAVTACGSIQIPRLLEARIQLEISGGEAAAITCILD